MMVSAEIRWFWQKHCPERLMGWFCDALDHGFAAGGGPPWRIDEYLLEAGQQEVGIKNRGAAGDGVEIKSLVEAGSEFLSSSPFSGPIEVWNKVKSRVLKLSGLPLISIEKQRRLRKFDTKTDIPVEIQLKLDSCEAPMGGGTLPSQGCNVEFTAINGKSLGQEWWTLGFEAFGPVSTLISSLRATAAALAIRNPPPLSGSIMANYPSWLAHLEFGKSRMLGGH
jgi:hypothetical protein